MLVYVLAFALAFVSDFVHAAAAEAVGAAGAVQDVAEAVLAAHVALVVPVADKLAIAGI